MEGQQAGDEGVATPGGDHVAIEEGTEGAPQHGAELEGLDPEVEGEDEEEDGDGLIVVAAGNRARNVARGDAHEDGGKEAGRRRGGHLVGEEVGGDGSQAREGRGQEDADVADVDRDGQGTEGVVDGAARHHEARVEGASGDSAEGVPCAVVEPVPELVEAVGDQVLCCPEVEPGVDWRRVSGGGGGGGGGAH